MAFLGDIEKLESRTFVLAFLDFLFLISPGVIVIFLYQRELFLTLDWLRIILLSISIMSPFVFLNILTFITLAMQDEQRNKQLFSTISLGIIVTGFLTYVVLCIDYFWNIPFKADVIMLIGIEILFFILAFNHYNKANQKNKSKE